MKRYLTVLSAVLIAFIGSAGPAAAAGELGISGDGIHYSPTFHGPLFSSAVKWVPGDSRTATFYARNQSSDVANLTVTLLGNHVGQLLDSGDIIVTATGGGGLSTSTTGVGPKRLLLVTHVAGGEVVPVHVTVGFSFSSPNDTQLESTDLNFRVTLAQSTTNNGGGTGGGTLPNTGAPSITWIVLLSSILLGTGLAIVSRRSHNQQGESHV